MRCCTVDNCGRAYFAKGLCQRHYERKRKSGQIELLSLEDRFWKKVNKTEGCWLWTGGKNADGYGIVCVASTREAAHRVSWKLHNGPIPEGRHVLHHCDNPPCVRPDHLFLGDQVANVADMMAKGRGLKSRGEQQANAKLTEQAVRDIRDSSLSQRALARKYGVKHKAIGCIKRRETWTHV